MSHKIEHKLLEYLLQTLVGRVKTPEQYLYQQAREEFSVKKKEKIKSVTDWESERHPLSSLSSPPGDHLLLQ